MPPARRLTILTALAATLAPANALAAPGDTILASHVAGTPADQQVSNPVISGDGSTVVFTSKATNFSVADDDATYDVFAKALGSPALTLVSAKPPLTAADFDSTSADVSENGRYVVFRSPAINLSDDDQDNTDDIYRRDLQTGAIELVSRASGVAGAAGDDDSGQPSISADGRLVAFQSDATNLSASDEDDTTDIFVRDMTTHTTYLASRSLATVADDDSQRAQISADGWTVVFASDATNLAGGVMAKTDVFAHDLATGTSHLVSRQSSADGGAAQDGDGGSSEALAVSADGNRVAWATTATNLAGGGVQLKIVLRDRAAQTTTLVSRADGAAGAAANGSSFQPAMSADGTKVAFHTYATNIDALDTDASGDVYVRDVAAQTTSLASRRTMSRGGEKGDDASFAASISADGTKVAFTSYADNFADVAGYANGQTFVHEMGGQVPVPTAPSAPAAASDPAPTGAPPAPVATGSHPVKKLRARLAFSRGTSSCIRHGRLVLKLKVFQGAPGAKVVRASVRVNRGKAKRLRGGKARRVVLRGLHGRRVTVRITARANTGDVLIRTRTYRRCAR